MHVHRAWLDMDVRAPDRIQQFLAREHPVRVREEEFQQPTRNQYGAEGTPDYATARLWDDGIIAPSETRRVLALCFSAASLYFFKTEMAVSHFSGEISPLASTLSPTART